MIGIREVTETLAKADVAPRRGGRSTRPSRQALTRYHTNYYTEAAPGFQRVLELYPGNTVAAELLKTSLAEAGRPRGRGDQAGGRRRHRETPLWPSRRRRPGCWFVRCRRRRRSCWSASPSAPSRPRPTAEQPGRLTNRRHPASAGPRPLRGAGSTRGPSQTVVVRAVRFPARDPPRRTGAGREGPDPVRSSHCTPMRHEAAGLGPPTASAATAASPSRRDAVNDRALIGQEVAGYYIEDIIGKGGMAVVYLALDPRLSRRVALKILNPVLERGRPVPPAVHPGVADGREHRPPQHHPDLRGRRRRRRHALHRDALRRRPRPAPASSTTAGRCRSARPTGSSPRWPPRWTPLTRTTDPP